MSKSLREANLSSRAARDRLEPRGKPYYRHLDQGLHLGYRKGSRGATWVVRWYVGDEAYKVESLDGRPDDELDADGETVLSFRQAEIKARKIFVERQRAALGLDASPRQGPYTVADALDDYVAHYRAGHTKGGGKAVKDTETRINAFIRPALGTELVSRLTSKRLRDWHVNLAAQGARLRTTKRAKDGKAAKQRFRESDAADPENVRQRRATANRTLTVLKAALNHCFREGKATTDEAWRRVVPFREADVSKVRYLDPEEAKRIVNGTAAAFRPLVQAALLTGCRYGEIAAFRVADFDADSGTVTVRAAKSGKPRHVVLTDDGVSLLTTHTAGKLGDALIFARPDGVPWGKSHQHRPLRAACKNAKITPAASFHILRHTYATILLRAGVPLPVIAANLGHADTRMTERHYAHLAPSHVANVIRAAMPSLGLVRKTNVTPLRRGTKRRPSPKSATVALRATAVNEK